MALVVLDNGKKKIASKIGISDPVTGDDLQINEDGEALVKGNPADFRLVIVYLAKIAERLENIETQLSLVTDEEL